MKKIDRHIEIVRCGIPQLSSMGLKSCQMIRETLAQHYMSVGVSYISNEVDVRHLIAKQPDLAFLGFKNLAVGQNQGTLWISDSLAEHGINYTGSSRPAIELDHNKAAAKRAIHDAGLATASYFEATPGQYPTAQALPLEFPLFIKPPEQGGGKGIDDDSIVRDFPAFERKVATIMQTFGTPALVERYLTGREFSVALLETTDHGELLAMPIELITQPNDRGDQILSRKVKSDDTEHVIAVEPGIIRDKLIALGKDSFRALGARDYGRVDIRMDAQGEMYFLEANLIPGLAQHDFTSYFTSACQINQGMDYEAIILHIVELGLSRKVRSNALMPDIKAANLILRRPFEPVFEPI